MGGLNVENHQTKGIKIASKAKRYFKLKKKRIEKNTTAVQFFNK